MPDDVIALQRPLRALTDFAVSLAVLDIGLSPILAWEDWYDFKYFGHPFTETLEGIQTQGLFSPYSASNSFRTDE